MILNCHHVESVDPTLFMGEAVPLGGIITGTWCESSVLALLRELFLEGFEKSILGV